MPARESLPAAFYDRDVVEVARDLLGKTLICRGSAGVIVETEAYHQDEPSCHAYRGRTERTEPLFGDPGTAYVYFTYGMHWCFNAVCCARDEGAAVLIRAVVPTAGIELMYERRRRNRPLKPTELCSGPAKLVQAMDIRSTDNTRPLWRGVNDPGDSEASGELAIVDDAAGAESVGIGHGAFAVAVGPRIGISAAQDLPWRFGVKGSCFLSKPFPGWGVSPLPDRR